MTAPKQLSPVRQERKRQGRLLDLFYGEPAIGPERQLDDLYLFDGDGYFVYRVFDGEYLLYIGQTNNLLLRLGQHRKGSSWWSFATRVTWVEFPSRDRALLEEANAIHNEGPEWNSPAGGDWLL